MTHPFRQVDVFGQDPCTGNPVAVVLDAEGIDEASMRRFSAWTNLSECTFVLPPTDAEADYRVRIFALDHELPFAGHPTLGTARAWLDTGGVPRRTGVVVQECGVGLVPVRVDGDLLAFAAPPRIRSGSVDEREVARVVEVLGVDPASVLDAEWLDNGPGWVGLLLDSAETVLSLRPDAAGHPGRWDIGVAGPTGDAAEPWEVRAFFGHDDLALREDPVTGSLNAALAQWLLSSGRATAPYVARQGTVLGRRGRVHLDQDDDGIWVGGRTHVVISGSTEPTFLLGHAWPRQYPHVVTTVNVGQAKTELSRLIALALAGEDVEISRDGVPVVRLVALEHTNPGARFLAARGSLTGKIRIGDDFEFTDSELDEMLDP